MIPLFGVLIEHQVTAHDVGVVTGKLCFDKGLCNVLPVFCNEHQAGHRCTDIFCDFKIVGEHSVAEQLTADPVWCVAGNIQQILQLIRLHLMLDHNTIAREGDLEPFVKEFKGETIMIDHHPDPDNVTYRISDTSVSSTCELLYSVIAGVWGKDIIDRDIANAIYMGTDAIMLSGETAYGAYPVEAVTVMREVAEENEGTVPPDASRSLVRINNEITAALARSAVKTATMLPIKAIVVDTLSGRTARYLSAFRSDLPVYARCYNERVMRELALSFGVYPYYTEKPMSRDEFMNDLPEMLLQNGIKEDDYVVVVGGSFGHGRGASFIEVCKIGEIH